MHDGVIWFDTAACWLASHIGQANAVAFNSNRFTGKNNWWSDTADAPTATNYDEYSRPIADPDTRNDAWDTDLIATGTFNLSEKDLYKDYLKDLIELYEDCDIDC